MNKKHTVSSIWRVLLAIVAILMTSGITPAAVSAYTLGYTDGTWSNARTTSGGTPTCLKYSNTANTTDENAVAYGNVPGWSSYYCPSSLDLTRQSGFGFHGVQSISFAPGETFVLGEFTHYNNPIQASNKMDLVDLAITLNFTDPAISTTLNYTVQLEETPNSGWCEYGGNCNDKVDFADTVANETFEIGGVFYTLQIVGFIPGTLSSYDPSDTPINQFITEEDAENNAVLIGRIIVAEPSISLTKTVDDPVVYEGDSVGYSFEVTNNGDVDLDNVVLSDPLLDSISTRSGDVGNDGILSVGETWTYTGQLNSAPAAGFVNTATVTADVVGDSTSVSDTDTAEFTVIHPDIEIVKTADADTLHEGDTVTYEFVVTNTGDANLTSVDVTDPLAGLSSLTLVDDGNGDAVLAPAESWTYEATLTAGSSDISNTATAEGYDVLGGRVSDTDSEFVEVISPAIELTKSVSPTVAQAGDVVTYTLVAENTGDTPLYNIQIDDGLPGVTLDAPVESGTDDDIMQVGETWTWIGTLTIAGSADVVNTATVSGDDELDRTVDDEDGATVDVVNPSLTIDKVADVSVAEIGDTINYTITVTNNGDITLTNVVVTDAKLSINQNVGSLAVGASKVVTGTYGPVAESDVPLVHNVAYAVSDQTESVNDDADVTINTNPGLTIDKVADVSVAEIGDTINYTITVTNDGDITLTNVVVTDAKLSINQNVGSLAVGASKVVTGTYGPVAESDVPLVHNVAYAVSDQTESVNDDADVTINTNPGLAIDKVADVSVAEIGDTINYTITVTNNGDITLTNVTVTDAKLSINQNVGSLAVGASKVVTGTYGPVAESDVPLVHNVAYAVSDQTESVNDDADVTINTNPGLTIDKVADVSVAEIGDTINYTITVTNDGDITLTNVVVTDAKLSIDQNVGSLAPGASKDVTGSYGPVAESDVPLIHNVAYAVSDQTESVNDDADVEIETNPSLTIDKVADVSVAEIGDTINYTITVTNNGDITLTNVVVTDAKLSINQNVGSLAVGASKVVTGTYGPVAESDVPLVHNVAYAVSDQTESVNDDADVTINTNPGLTIDKVADVSVAEIGDTINYTITVTNDGDITLTNVVVTDAKLSINQNVGSLAVGASKVVTGTYGPVAESDVPLVHNVAYAVSDQTESVNDDADVTINTNPGLTIDKVADVSVAEIGDTINYTITVTNNGDITLTNVVVTDAKLGINQNVGSLAVGASKVVTGTYGPVAESDVPLVHNVAYAVSDQTESVNDDADVTINTNPGLTIDKVADVSVVAIGGTINYTITVTNDGDITLTNVVVTDAKLGISQNVGSLAPQESKVVTGSYGPVTEDDLPSVYNVAYAASDQTQSVQDDVTVDLATEPGLAIDKTGPSTVVAGDYIEYTITVSNIGNVTLHNVVVTDTKLGLVATLPELAVGASQVITGTYGPVSEADQPGPVHNVATADSDETGPVSDDHDVEIEQPFEPRAALEIVKTGDAVVNIGEMIDYEITVTNIGNVDLNNVVVTDAKLGLNQTIALLAVGDSETINASYGPVTEADGDQVVNTAVADSDETDPEEDDWTTVVVSTPGLAITKTGPATAEVGDTIDYEITVMNTGDVTLHNVVVTDARLGYTETLAELAPGASVVLTVSYGPVGEADLPGPIINTAVAEADEAGPVEDSWSVDLEVPYYEEPEDCVRADVSVVIYGGWNDIAVRAWVGGTEQDMLYTETNADGEAQVMWTLYPPESGSWSVQVAPELPSGLDATRWEYRLVRVESPSEDWSTENPSSATVTVRRCNQYVFYYQLYDKGTTEEIVTPPVLPQTGNIDMVTSANNGLVLWLKVGFLGLLGMVGLISSRNKKETEK